MKGYSIWAAVVYIQKYAADRVCRTQRAMTIKSYKTKDEFTHGFIKETARDWMGNWAGPVDFLGLDYENHQPPYSYCVARC